MSARLSLFATIALFATAAVPALAPTVAHAADGGAFYRAELAQPVAQQTIVAGGVAWHCNESACSAGKASSRDAIVCAKLAKEVGALTSFASRKGALEAGDLERCNAAA